MIGIENHIGYFILPIYAFSNYFTEMISYQWQHQNFLYRKSSKVRNFVGKIKAKDLACNCDCTVLYIRLRIVNCPYQRVENREWR